MADTDLKNRSEEITSVPAHAPGESGAELRELFAAMTDVVIVYDAQGRYRRIAPTNPSRLYRPAGEMLGKTVHEVLPAPQADAFLGYIRRALEARRTVNAEYSLQIGETEYWFAAAISPMTDDSVIWVARDITERKRTEQALLENEILFRTAFDYTVVGMAMVSTDGSFLQVNRSWCELVGYSEAELLNMKFRDITHPEDVDSSVAYLRQTLAGEIKSFQAEKRYLHKTGQVVWVQLFAALVRDRHGLPLCFISQIQDITKRKRTEAERERLLADLEHRAVQLQTAAEVSRAASSILNLDELLPQTVELIRERFDLYYVGIFLLDEARQHAVLRAGSGEAGRIMLERSHRLQIGDSSMIGWCVAHEQARIALDVGAESVRFENPLLPLTRSELALPLISRGQVLGAMTVQSVKEAAFSQADITALQTMADQIANAIANAGLFEQTQAALAETRQRAAELATLNSINQAISSQLEINALISLIVDKICQVFEVEGAYVALYDSRTNLIHIPCMAEGDQRLAIDPYPLGPGLTSAIIQTRRPLLINQDTERRMAELGARVVGDPSKSYLGVPMTLGDNVVGVIAIQSTQQEGLFGEAEERLLSIIAPSVGIAIQNARLFDQAQAALADSRRRAQREQSINRIAARLRGSVSVDEVLQIAVDELRQATQSTRAVARLEAHHQEMAA